MPKITTPIKCVKCDSERIKLEELTMGGRHGESLGRVYKFYVYICEECGYSELFYKGKSSWG